MNDEFSLSRHRDLLSRPSEAAAGEARPQFDELWDTKTAATVASLGAIAAAPFLLRRGQGDKVVAGAEAAAAKTAGAEVLTGSSLRLKPVSLADELAGLEAPTARITDAERRAAVLRVQDALANKPEALSVLDNFARAEARQIGVNVQGMSTTRVLSELSELSAGNASPEKLADRIVGYAQRGNFKDIDLANRQVAEMLTNMGNHGNNMPEAIGLATNFFGADISKRSPGIVYTMQELINNGAIAKNIDLAEARAAVLLSHARHEGLSTMRGAAWRDLQITPNTVGIVRNSPHFSIADQQLKPAVVDKVLNAVRPN